MPPRAFDRHGMPVHVDHDVVCAGGHAGENVPEVVAPAVGGSTLAAQIGFVPAPFEKDQLVARPGRRHVEETGPLSTVALPLPRPVLAEPRLTERLPACSSDRPH